MQEEDFMPSSAISLFVPSLQHMHYDAALNFLLFLRKTLD